MTLDIEKIREYCKTGQIIYSKHFMDRCRERSIRLAEAEAVIMTGDVIEEYPDDYPFPSCLFLGLDSGHNSLHVVCAQGEKRLYMISAYRPSPEKWEPNMRTRKEGASQ